MLTLTKSLFNPQSARIYCRYTNIQTPLRAMSRLVSTEYLANNIQRQDIKVIDGSWHLPIFKRNARKEYEEKHIPNAVFFDIDEVSDKSTNLPHMLPSISQFENSVSKLGITEKDHVIVYDANGVNAGVRVYWTFKVFGHKQISVLDGGLPKWLREGRPVEAGIVKKNPTQYKVAKFHSQLVKDYRQIVENIGKSKSDPSFVPVVDARPHARFTGEAPEPRAGITSGHMPNSISIPFTSVVDGQSNTLLPKEKLQELFQSKGLDLNKPIITSCGSGVTASIVLLALEEAGAKNVALYDGSWAEYASKAGSTIVKGED